MQECIQARTHHEGRCEARRSRRPRSRCERSPILDLARYTETLKSPVWRRIESNEVRARRDIYFWIWSMYSSQWSKTPVPAVSSIYEASGYTLLNWSQAQFNGNFDASIKQSLNLGFFEDEVTGDIKKDVSGDVNTEKSKVIIDPLQAPGGNRFPFSQTSSCGSTVPDNDPTLPSDAVGMDGKKYRHVVAVPGVPTELCEKGNWKSVFDIQCDRGWNRSNSHGHRRVSI